MMTSMATTGIQIKAAPTSTKSRTPLSRPITSSNSAKPNGPMRLT